MASCSAETCHFPGLFLNDGSNSIWFLLPRKIRTRLSLNWKEKTSSSQHGATNGHQPTVFSLAPASPILTPLLNAFKRFLFSRAMARNGNMFFPRASKRRVLPIVGVCISSSHLHILSSSHLLILTSSHLHIFSSSHLLIFTFSRPHIFSSSHLPFSSSHPLIFTFSYLHIFTSSHPQISSSHLHIFSSSHLHIFTYSHPHIFTPSHLHIFSSSRLLIFTSSHLLIFTSAHLHIFTSSHLLILTSSHLHILTSSHLLLLPSCPHIFTSSPLALSFFSISLRRRRAVPTRRHETQPFRTK